MVRIEGLEDLVRTVVREEIERALHGEGGWLTATEAGRYLGVSRGQIHNLVSSGALPRHQPKGHGLRFRRADLDAYAESRR